jgi:hypothetical protein
MDYETFLKKMKVSSNTGGEKSQEGESTESSWHMNGKRRK